ncbi:fructose-specific PTS transporter subunit EIIC [Spiroplasma endosymbiont of Labia minor]|uniref:PTS fructose transporter subunit IIABC n=1 Tax=Spiroplasma endosymbiont of Labia minor TaxID=3066305 RepID=UPI0030D33E2F
MNLLSQNFVFLDEDLKTQDNVFKFIADKAMDAKIISDSSALINGFKKRESEGSTGFEDGFAIPHARIKEANSAAIIIVRTKTGIEWKSIDGKPTRVAIALIVPDGQGNQHMEMLSDVAVKLMNEDFKKAILNAKTAQDVIKAFDIKKENKIVSNESQNGGPKVLAITACITGVAHTYLAEEKLLQAGEKLGYNVRVETHGSKGVGTPFTAKEINEADAIIFAVDTGVDKSRFSGLKSIEVKVAKAIHDPEGLINEVLKNGKILAQSNSSQPEIKSRDNVMKHILAGVSYMIPVIVLGGICLAFSLGIAKAIWGPGASPDNGGKSPWGILNVLNIIGGAAFTLMIPILGGFIANSIGGRAAIAPAMVASFIGNNSALLMSWIPGLDQVATPMGFLGAIAAGLMAGYLVKWINTWRVPRSLQAAMPIFFIPLGVGLILSLLFIYLIGAPIGWIMNEIQVGIGSAYGVTFENGQATGGSSNVGIVTGLLIGLLLGAMGGFDMGGPVNKIAFLTCSALVTASAGQPEEVMNVLQRPMGALAAAIPVAPIGMGLTTLIFSKYFDDDSRNMGVGAIVMGCIGISEGAIPFAIRDPKRAVVCNVLGSAVAGAIAGAAGVQDAAAHGGPIVAILGAVPYGSQTALFFIAAAAGVAVTTLIYGFWLIADAGKPGSVKERHVNYLATIATEYKDNEIDLKDKIVAIKNTRRTEIITAKENSQDIEPIKTKFVEQIQAVKEEIVLAKNAYKEKILAAKNAYKEYAILEKAAIKEQRVEIKNSTSVFKDVYIEKMQFIAEKNNNRPNFDNSLKKREFNQEIKQSKFVAKTNYKDSVISDSIKRRSKFVSGYESKLIR